MYELPACKCGHKSWDHIVRARTGEAECLTCNCIRYDPDDPGGQFEAIAAAYLRHIGYSVEKLVYKLESGVKDEDRIKG